MLRFPAASCSHTCPCCPFYYLVLSSRWSVVAGQNRILCWGIQTSGTQGFKSFILFHSFFSYVEVLTFVAASPFSSFTFNSKVKGKYIFKTAVWVFFKCDLICVFDTRNCGWVYCRTGGGGGVHVPTRL